MYFFPQLYIHTQKLSCIQNKRTIYFIQKNCEKFCSKICWNPNTTCMKNKFRINLTRFLTLGSYMAQINYDTPPNVQFQYMHSDMHKCQCVCGFLCRCLCTCVRVRSTFISIKLHFFLLKDIEPKKSSFILHAERNSH